MDNDVPYVDLSRMLQQPKCAIMAASEEEAEWLLSNAIQQFPEHTGNWRHCGTLWSKGNRGGRGTCYTLFDYNSSSPTRMTYSPTEWFEENGYEVIAFAELMHQFQEDIEESDSSLDALFS